MCVCAGAWCGTITCEYNTRDLETEGEAQKLREDCCHCAEVMSLFQHGNYHVSAVTSSRAVYPPQTIVPPSSHIPTAEESGQGKSRVRECCGK